MEVVPSTDRKNLEQLLDAFGSVVSLKDIASAYCQSGRDLYAAGEILSNLQRSSPKASSTPEEELESVITSSECQSENSRETAQFTESKPRRSAASTGTISGVIGRDYVRFRPAANRCSKTKPLKLSSNDIPASAIWDEQGFPDTTTRSETMHRELEEFLFKMLGDGFSLEMGTIQEIAGQCGYDMKKSMEKLLDLSASTLEKSDDVLKVASEKYPKLVSKQYDSQFPCIDSSGSSKCIVEAEKALKLPDIPDERYALQKEVLGSLFTGPERSGKEPEKSHSTKEVRRSRAYGKIVEEPLQETMIEHRPVITRRQVTTENNDGEDEDNYEVLRKAVREYWITMKEYYKAAVDAFSKQDHERAYKLLEEGHFFMRKAREADEKSAQKLLERNDEEEMVVDVHDFDPKEAVRFLKVQLTTLSGISSFRCLRLLVGSDDENSKHVFRKRMVIKLLEREKIRWSEEEGNGWIIVIPLDEINPKSLSFAKR